MENNFLNRAKVLLLYKSFDGKHATIVVDVYDVNKKKNSITTFSGCEILPDGKYRKEIKKRNIGIDYLYF